VRANPVCGLLHAHRPNAGTCIFLLRVRSMCAERCFPPAAPFPPHPPQQLALPCSDGSQVLRRSPTSPARASPSYGFGPSRTGLRMTPKAHWRSPGSRPCCFSACTGSNDYAGPDNHSRLTQLPYCLPPTHQGVGILIHGFSKLNHPAHRCLDLRFAAHLAMCNARLEVRMDSLFPFLQRLAPLQHVGLSRRTVNDRQPGNVNPEITS